MRYAANRMQHTIRPWSISYTAYSQLYNKPNLGFLFVANSQNVETYAERTEVKCDFEKIEVIPGHRV